MMIDNKQKDKIVTVLIPCYNVEKYLKKLFKSILKQENKELVKFIFLDDASKDNTLDKIKKFKEENQTLSIEIIEEKINQKIAEARNILISKVETPYFYFIDPDDYFIGKLIFNKFIKTIENKQYDLIVLKGKLRFQINKHDFLIDKLTIKSPLCNNVKPKNNHEIDPVEYICKNDPFAWNVFVRTEFYKELNIAYLKNYIFEDFPIVFLMFLNAKSAYFINYYSHVYCSRPTGLAREENFDKFNGAAANQNYLYETLTKFNKLDLFINKYQIENRFFRRLLFSLINKKIYKKTLKDLNKYSEYFLKIYEMFKKWQIIERLDNSKKYSRFINKGYKRLKKIINLIQNKQHN